MISITVLDLTLLAWSIWTAGCVLLAGLTFFKVSPTAMPQMWRLLVSEGIFIALATIPFLIGGIAVPTALAVLSLRAGWECAQVTGTAWKLPKRIDLPSRLAGAALMGAAAAAGWFLPWSLVLGLCAAALIACVAVHMIAPHPRANAGAGLSVAAALLDAAAFPGMVLALFALVARVPESWPLIVLAFIHVEIFDSLAVLGGKLIGKTPLFARLSPNKTWEGFISGLCALAVLSMGYNLVAHAAPLWAWAGLALAGGIGAVAGDIAASVHKRAADMKDYPPIYAPQGGALDMVDAWITAVPLTVAAAWSFGLFTA